jgi:hypothetical protein
LIQAAREHLKALDDEAAEPGLGARRRKAVDGHEDPRLLGHRGAFLALSPDVP